jgi:NAD(P)-dependent dehydrogenase (short-subunit alcohol dehydrogenase family)
MPPMHSRDHPNRVVLTGGSSGIGLATARAFLDAGYEVINISRRNCPLDSPRLTSITVDLSDAAATRGAVMAAAGRAPATTIVHCAGAVFEKSIEDATLEDLANLGNLHLGAALSLVQANLQAMKQARYGRIVLISSRAVLGLARRTAYASTKAGMLGLARTWALELAVHGVTVNVVAPGPIAETEMFEEIIPAASARMAAAAKQVPVGRFGTPQDVARAVLFFTDPQASFVTGQTLFVCGGTSVGSIVY